MEFSIYSQGNIELGVATIDLPAFEATSESVKGSGIIGEIDLPTLFALGSSEVTLNYRSVAPNMFGFLAPKRQDIEARWVAQKVEQSTYTADFDYLRIVIKGFTKSVSPGSLDTAGESSSSVAIEAVYLKVEDKNTVLLELDKINGKYVVNGNDYHAPFREWLAGSGSISGLDVDPFKLPYDSVTSVASAASNTVGSIAGAINGLFG